MFRVICNKLYIPLKLATTILDRFSTFKLITMFYNSNISFSQKLKLTFGTGSNCSNFSQKVDIVKQMNFPFSKHIEVQ